MRDDGIEILLNVKAIRQVEEGPKTTIILVDGEQILVRNALFDISTKIKAADLGRLEEERVLAQALAEVKKQLREETGETEKTPD